MDKTMYIALLRANLTEPPFESGYARVPMAGVSIMDLVTNGLRGNYFFPVVQQPGWGEITDICIYDAPVGGNPLLIAWTPAPIDCHAGTIPVIHDGRLLRGVDVSAEIKLYATATAGAAAFKK